MNSPKSEFVPGFVPGVTESYASAAGRRALEEARRRETEPVSDPREEVAKREADLHNTTLAEDEQLGV